MYQDEDGYEVESFQSSNRYDGKLVALVRQYNEPVAYLETLPSNSSKFIVRRFGPRDTSQMANNIVYEDVIEAVAKIKEG